MKKYINLILGISFLILLGLILWINYLVKNNVGDIAFDENLDDPSFVVCNEDRIFQYYSVGTHYIGERKAMREFIFNYLKDKELDLSSQSGYITFRFIVNCKGKAGRYRYKTVDKNFSATIFRENEIEKMKNAVKELNNWNVGVLKNGRKVDSYYQINIKIVDGVIIDIF